MHTIIHSIRFSLAISLAMLVLAVAVAPVLAQSAPALASSRQSGVVDIVRDPGDVPPPVGDGPAAIVRVELTAKEVVGKLDPGTGTTYRYWTFDGKVPGPMIRVRQGDMVEVTLHNHPSSQMVHSIDFHAAIGPGGGAALSQVPPGESKTFTFQASTPGLFVYHCGTPMIADHIANGMYGLILVEPRGGLPHVDHEYYIMQGEIYTTAPKGKAGLQSFSEANLLHESPEYFVFNGAVDALTKEHPLRATVGDSVRIFFGDAGPNATSSPHVVGEIFTREYLLGSLGPPLSDVQTASVPPGGAAILELKAVMPGQFALMDHAMARMAKGLAATLEIVGPENAAFMHAGSAATGSTGESKWVSGMTSADTAAASSSADVGSLPRHSGAAELSDVAQEHAKAPSRTKRYVNPRVPAPGPAPAALNGCLTLLDDGRVVLKLLGSEKIYRLEARPFLFEENNHHLVHVTGYFGSVVPQEDPRIASFVVDTLDELASSCSAKLSLSALRRANREAAAERPGSTVTVGMGDMEFKPREIVIHPGQEVVWKNTSQVLHNVIDDGRALNKADVQRPATAPAFGSKYLQPSQTFAHTFTVPGVYRYVCTLHEANGMKGVIIVQAPGAVAIARGSEAVTAPGPSR